MFEDITDSAQELLNKLGKVGSEEFKLQARIKQLEELVDCLYDDNPCEYDHHGYCQAHGWMDKSPCPMKRIREIRASEGKDE